MSDRFIKVVFSVAILSCFWCISVNSFATPIKVDIGLGMSLPKTDLGDIKTGLAWYKTKLAFTLKWGTLSKLNNVLDTLEELIQDALNASCEEKEEEEVETYMKGLMWCTNVITTKGTGAKEDAVDDLPDDTTITVKTDHIEVKLPEGHDPCEYEVTEEETCYPELSVKLALPGDLLSN